jgi:hypothetical protein
MTTRFILYCTMFFIIITLPASYIDITYGQQQQKSLPPSSKVLFTPLAYLQYGPAPNEAVTMYLRTVEFFDNHNNSRVYLPYTIMSNFSNAKELFPADVILPTFDSYFSLNRLLPQIIPKPANISVSMSHILNPFEARYTTQAKLGADIRLSHPDNDNKSFVIPRSLVTGIYLAKMSVDFPDYKINATYSNTIFMNSTTPSAMSLSNFSSPFK